MNVVAGRFQYIFFICRASPQLADSLTISDFVELILFNEILINKDQESSLNIFLQKLTRERTQTRS